MPVTVATVGRVWVGFQLSLFRVSLGGFMCNLGVVEGGKPHYLEWPSG